MNLDTNIALGYKPTPIDFNAMNQGNVLANMAQLRSADNQNALAQYQLSSAKRTDDSQTALMAAAQVPGFKIDFPTAIKYGAPGMAAYKAQEDASTQALGRQKTQLEIDTSANALQQKKLIQAIQELTNLNTAEEGTAAVKKSLASKNIDESRANQLIKDLQTKPFKDVKDQQLKGLLTAYEQVQNATSIANNAATNATSVANNANTVAQAAASALMTDTRSREQFKQTQGLAERKFKWEQANQGMTYVEGPSGTAFGYNPKTNQMTPITNAPAAGTNAMAPAAGPNTNALAAPAPAQAVAPSAAPVAQPPAAAGTAGPMGITLPANAAAGVNAPGTPFVGKGASKPIPDNINLAILKNDQNIKSLQNTINLLAKNPDAVGVKGYMPQAVLNRKDPKGVDARAGIADIGSLVLHDRSGAAVTASESPRLMPFIPLITDDIKTATKKLTRMLEIAKDDQLGLTQTYSKEQGFAVNPIARQSNSSNQAGDIHSQADAVLRGNQ